MGSPRPKAVLFLNPAAASGGSRPGEAAAILARHFDLVVHTPPSAAALHETAAREAREGSGLVIAAGGDGTVNVIINAIAGTGAALGVLPIGTANDFARHVGIPQNSAAAARRIIHGDIQRCDVVAVNGRRFCTVGALGLVTECALIADRLRSAGHPLRPFARCIGPAIYPVVGISKILFGKRAVWEVTLSWTEPGGKKLALHAVGPGMFVANQRVLGGGLTLPVEACDHDGAIEICVAAAASRLSLLRTVLALRMAWPIGRNVMAVHRATRARIESGQELGFLGDGELLCVGKHFEVEVLAGGCPSSVDPTITRFAF